MLGKMSRSWLCRLENWWETSNRRGAVATPTLTLTTSLEYVIEQSIRAVLRI